MSIQGNFGYSTKETANMVLHQNNTQELFEHISLFLEPEHTSRPEYVATFLRLAWQTWYSDKYWLNYLGYVPEWLPSIKAEISDFSKINWEEVASAFLDTALGTR